MDIKKDPDTFILRMTSVVTHMVIESTLIRNQSFLAPFDPYAQQNDVILREVVYTLLVTREILTRLFTDEPARLREVAWTLLCEESTQHDGQNILQKNY